MPMVFQYILIPLGQRVHVALRAIPPRPHGQSARPAFDAVDLALLSAAGFDATDEASEGWSAADDGVSGDCGERADFLPLAALAVLVAAAAGGVTAPAEDDDDTGEFADEVEVGDAKATALALSDLALADGGVDTADA